MKNITYQTPYEPLHGRLKFVTSYVKDIDLRNKKVLDIGCGYGWFEIYAKSKNIQIIIGTELSKPDLLTAKRYIHDNSIKFVIADATHLPFKDSTFDTVVSWEVLEHIPKASEKVMFSEIARILKENGICYLSTPYKSFFNTLFDPAYWLTGHRHYEMKDIYSFINNKFSVINFSLVGGWWVILSSLNMYISKWIFRRSIFFKKYFDIKQDQEFSKPNGFTNIFLRLKKINSGKLEDNEIHRSYSK